MADAEDTPNHPGSDDRLLERLIAEGRISSDDRESFLEEQRSRGGRRSVGIHEILFENGVLTQAELVEVAASRPPLGAAPPSPDELLLETLIAESRISLQECEAFLKEQRARGGRRRVELEEILFENGVITQAELIAQAAARQAAGPPPPPPPAEPASLAPVAPADPSFRPPAVAPRVASLDAGTHEAGFVGDVLLARGLVDEDQLGAALTEFEVRFGSSVAPAFPAADDDDDDGPGLVTGEVAFEEGVISLEDIEAELGVVQDVFNQSGVIGPLTGDAPLLGGAGLGAGPAPVGFDADPLAAERALQDMLMRSGSFGRIEDSLAEVEERFGDLEPARRPKKKTGRRTRRPDARPARPGFVPPTVSPEPKSIIADLMARSGVDDGTVGDILVERGVISPDDLEAALTEIDDRFHASRSKDAKDAPGDERQRALDRAEADLESSLEAELESSLEAELEISLETELAPPPRPTAETKPKATPKKAAAKAKKGEKAPAAKPKGESSAAETEEERKQLVRFILKEKVGRGNLGVVFRAEDVLDDRPIAVKFMLDPAYAEEQSVRETTVIRELRHTGIVPVHTAGTTGGRLFLARDFVEGDNIQALARRGTLGPIGLAEVFRDVAWILDHCHQRGAAHLNLKPQNIIIDRGGKPRLTDFGVPDRAPNQLPTAGVPWEDGVATYVAPEQADNTRGQVGSHTDVFSLGASLYHALTGTPPYLDGNVTDAMRQVLFEELDAPTARREAVPKELETIILRCMDREPGRRLPARIVADQLNRFARGEGQGIYVRIPARVIKAIYALTILIIVGAIAFGVLHYKQVAEERARRAAIAEKARRAFEAARDEEVAADRPDERRARDERVVKLGREAEEAAHAVVEVVPGDRRARATAFETSIEVARAATEAQRWHEADQSFRRAQGLDFDRAAADAAIGEATETRLGTMASLERAVGAVLDGARSGSILERRGGYDGGLWELVSRPQPQTVTLLASALDEVSSELEDAAAGFYLEASFPTADEARRGETEIAGLEGALGELAHARIAGVEADPAALALVEQAGRRLEARIGESEELVTLLAAQQTDRLGPGRALLARMCCDALGAIGQRDRATASLRRYILAERDELRAMPPALALVLLRGDATDPALRVALDRFGEGGAFGRRIVPLLADPESIDADAAESMRGFATRLLRARAQHGRGELEAAEATLTAAIERDENDADAHWLRGVVRLEAGAHDDALADLDRAVQLDPDDPAGWHDRGRVRAAIGQIGLAIEDYSQAVDLDPARAGAWADRGAAELARGNASAALTDLDQACRLDPAFARAHVDRGRALRALGREGDALRALDTAIARDRTVAAAWIEIGAIHRDGGRNDEAVQALTRAIEEAPGDPDTWAGRAAALLDMGDATGAIADLDEALIRRPDDPALYVLRGKAHQAAGAVWDALRDLSEAATLDPTSVEASRGLAEARLARGDHAGALRDLGRLVELAPDDPWAFLRRGGARVLTGDGAGAVADFVRAAELAPNDPEAWVGRGDAHRMTGKLGLAAADYDHAIGLDPRVAGAFVGRAELHAAAGRTAEALIALSEAIRLAPGDPIGWLRRGRAHRIRPRDWGRAVEDLERATELDPDLVEGWVELGEALLDGPSATAPEADGGPAATQTRLDRSRAAFARALEIELRPDRSPSPPALRVRAWRGRGRAAALRGDLTGAIADLGEALRLAPDDPLALRTRGTALSRRGRLREALDDLDRAVSLAPDDAIALLRRGEVRAARGDPPGALADLDAALALDARLAAAWTAKGKIHRDAGRRREAVDAFDQAIALDRTDARAFELRGYCHQEARDLAAADADLGRAIELTPDQARLHRARGETRQLLGRFADALGDLEKAVELDPSDAPTWHNRGICHQALGDLASAIADYGEAVDRDPELAIAWLFRGIARVAAGEGEAAVADLERCIEIDPDGPLVGKAKATIAKAKKG